MHHLASVSLPQALGTPARGERRVHLSPVTYHNAVPSALRHGSRCFACPRVRGSSNEFGVAVHTSGTSPSHRRTERTPACAAPVGPRPASVRAPRRSARLSVSCPPTSSGARVRRPEPRTRCRARAPPVRFLSSPSASCRVAGAAPVGPVRRSFIDSYLRRGPHISVNKSLRTANAQRRAHDYTQHRTFFHAY